MIPLPLDLQIQTSYTLPKLKLLPLREQPTHRVAQDPAACNLSELLAVVVGGQGQIETAEKILARFGDLHGLHRAHISEICTLPGIGQTTAVRLKAALALGMKLALDPGTERPTIHCPADAAALVQGEMGLLEKEHLRVILLDTRNHVLDIVEIYRGSVNSSQMRVAEVFKPAIQRTAAAILLLHNHPSQDPSPSPDDVAVTRAIVQAGELLDIPLVDHLILSRGGYVSLKERGLGFDAGQRARENRVEYRLREGDCEWELIHSYTRAQALEDGVLVDVSSMAREAGFRFPTAITADLHTRLTPTEVEVDLGQSYEGRLWDVLFSASVAARRAGKTDRVAFKVLLAEVHGDRSKPQMTTLNLWVVIGPGDHTCCLHWPGQGVLDSRGEAVITLGLPQDF
ncbi:MAG: DNA repair protein RadC [Anaerolineales bacterium]|jgi:DNA repair protein RadC